MRTIQVTGKGAIKLKPDMTRFTLTLSGTYPEYVDAVEHAAMDGEKLKDALESLGFARSDCKTLSFRVSEKTEHVYNADDGVKERFVGYEYRHLMKLEFDSDADLFGKVLYALGHLPFQPRFDIGYLLKDQESAKKRLLERAVKNAQEKASILARAAGVTLAEIRTIEYSWQEIDFSVRMVENLLLQSRTVAERYSYGVNLEPNDVEVSDTVTVVWEIS